MKQKTKAKKGGRSKRREWMIGAGLIAYLIGLIIRIPLGRIIGDQGMGFFSVGMEVFTVISIVLSYGLSKAVTVLIKYRVRREMFKSARRVYHNAMTMAVIVGALAAAGVFFFSEFIAETLVLEHMSYMAAAAAAPAVFLAVVMGVLRGYFQGMGTMIPTVHSKLLVNMIMFVSSLLAGSVLYRYGMKVAALLRNQEYAASYGAMGAAVGLSAACLFGLLHLLLIKMAYSGTFKQQLLRDTSKYTEANGQIVSMLLSTALPYMLCGLLYNMNYLADQRIYNYAVNLKEQGASRAVHWGVYYGKYSVVIGILAILCALVGTVGIPKIVQLYEKQERREVQFQLGRYIHSMAVIAVPAAVLTAVLAEPAAGVLFTGDQKTAVTLIQAGSTVILFFPFAYFFMGILQRIRKMKDVIFGGLAAFLLHLIVLVLLLMNTSMGITAVACGMIVFWLVSCAVGFIGVMRYLQYSQEWLRTFGITVIAAGISGLLGMLLSKALLPAGDIVTLLVCLIVCLIVYNLLLLLLKGVREEELEDMPGGRILIFLGEKLHLM